MQERRKSFLIKESAARATRVSAGEECRSLSIRCFRFVAAGFYLGAISPVLRRRTRYRPDEIDDDPFNRLFTEKAFFFFSFWLYFLYFLHYNYFDRVEVKNANYRKSQISPNTFETDVIGNLGKGSTPFELSEPERSLSFSFSQHLFPPCAIIIVLSVSYTLYLSPPWCPCCHAPACSIIFSPTSRLFLSSSLQPSLPPLLSSLLSLFHLKPDRGPALEVEILNICRASYHRR